MSWNFREHEQREEIAELKNQLAVQGVKLGQFESQLIKNNEELTTTKNTLDETVYKLRKEADHAIELEETLAKRSEDLRNEKLTRENVENALQAVREELKSQTASTRDAQHLLNRLAQDANGSQEQYMKLLVDKGKLEAQVRELQGELRIYQLAPPSPTKLATRPRASSLTNLKVANLERDLQQTRASASSSQIDLDTTREKLSKVQNDLVRVENEKAVFEKRMAEKDRKLQDALEEKDDLMRELDFLRSQNGSAGREEELIARLEEEESKVALYEQQLSQISQPNHLKRSLDRLHLQLANEITKREAIESQGVELVREKEEALDELDDMKRNVQELSETLRYKEAQIYELGRHERELQNQLDATRNLAASSPIEIDEGQVKHMLDAIDRLRAERDQLRTDFEFFQLETQFKVQALEKQVAFSQPSRTSVSDVELQQSQALAAHLSGKLNIGRIQVQKLQVAMSAMLVTVQYLHSQNEFLQERSLITATSQETAASRGHAEVETLHSQLNEQQVECSSLGATLADLQERLGAKHAEVDFVETESRTIFMSKDEELALAQARLSDASNTLESEREGRIALEQDVARLNANCASIRQELTDALERCEHLRDAQTSALPSDNGTRILKEEIKLLEGRVMRRTEQIGVHQHDIKRLETNMRLLEDRVEEVTGELDMAETEKTAMLEDCTTAREERDEAKKALELAEIEVERLTALVKQTKEEVRELQTHLAAAEGQRKESDAAKVDELATMANVVEERDSQINLLAENLKSAESALVEARAQTGNLRDELNLVQESTARTVEELQGQIQGDKSALAKELERRAGEMQRLSEELESVKASHEEFSDALQSKDKELQRSADEVQRLTSELEAAERSCRENDVDRRSKDEEVERYAAEVQRLSSELELARVKHHETADALLIRKNYLKEGRMSCNASLSNSKLRRLVIKRLRRNCNGKRRSWR
ncbi:hypothetical protein DFH11DRAFT_7013 [Phellopilus nigrolimitatus]|nr:hypothetical protein DFH11DRAFT_7013 [Phellopilus nigrolimitatus]